MDQFSAHAALTAANEPKTPASRNRLEGHLCVVGGECCRRASFRRACFAPEYEPRILPAVFEHPGNRAAAGASGIVGSGICRQLLMEGAKVAALLRREDQKEGLLKECQGEPGGWNSAGPEHAGGTQQHAAAHGPCVSAVPACHCSGQRIPGHPCLWPRTCLQARRCRTCSPTLLQTCPRRSSVSVQGLISLPGASLMGSSSTHSLHCGKWRGMLCTQ